jgi:hypothetical protein
MKRVIIIILLVQGLCYTVHSQCYQPWVIDHHVYCIALWIPICGCDGKIYDNPCTAYYHYGITSYYTMGEIIIDGPRTMCKGDTIQLTASGGIAYEWSTGDYSKTISISPETNKNYEVAVTFAGGCRLSRGVTIKVNPVYSTTEEISITTDENYYGWTTPGTYTRNLRTINGCDSVITTNLTIINIPTIILNTGWNIVSTFLMPSNHSLGAIFQNLMNDGSLIKVQDENGNFLEDLGIFGGWTNTIGNISPTEGYKVKVAHDCQLKFSGTSLKLPYEIPLKMGWNIVGYPQNTQKDALEIVQELIDRGTLVKVQDEIGNSLEDLGVFGGWKNNIGMFQPGKGYKIKVTKNEILTIE